MVKIDVFALGATLAAVFAPLAAANNCHKGMKYCGSTLLSIGKYSGDIDWTLSHADEAVSWHTIHHGLFLCSGNDGEIDLIKICYNCVDKGPGKNDVCSE